METMNSEPVRAVLSGSFHRDQKGLRRAYVELATNGCQILSPHRLHFDKAEFVRDEAEVNLSVLDIEKHHLLAIAQADFLWLHLPSGYIGLSTALEMGYALAYNKPIFSRQTPLDETIKQFVSTVPSVYDALVNVHS